MIDLLAELNDAPESDGRFGPKGRPAPIAPAVDPALAHPDPALVMRVLGTREHVQHGLARVLRPGRRDRHETGPVFDAEELSSGSADPEGRAPGFVAGALDKAQVGHGEAAVCRVERSPAPALVKAESTLCGRDPKALAAPSVGLDQRAGDADGVRPHERRDLPAVGARHGSGHASFRRHPQDVSAGGTVPEVEIANHVRGQAVAAVEDLDLVAVHPRQPVARGCPDDAAAIGKGGCRQAVHQIRLQVTALERPGRDPLIGHAPEPDAKRGDPELFVPAVTRDQKVLDLGDVEPRRPEALPGAAVLAVPHACVARGDP